jgi:hypothetical protein
MANAQVAAGRTTGGEGPWAQPRKLNLKGGFGLPLNVWLLRAY